MLSEIIKPFCHSLKNDRVISYGANGTSYDVRLGGTLKFFHWSKGNKDILDPKTENEPCFFKSTSESYFLIPPRGSVLAQSVETVTVPNGMTAFVLPKIEYAKCGLQLTQVVLSQGFNGKIDLNLTNSTDFPVKVYVGEGIAKVLFLEGE